MGLETIRSIQESGILYTGATMASTGAPIVQAEMQRRPKETEIWTHVVATGEEHRATDEEIRLISSTLPATRDATVSSIRNFRRSPNGKWIVYQTREGTPAESKIRYSRLMVRPLEEGSEPPIALATANLFESYWWSPESNEIYYSALGTDGRAPKLFAVSVKGGSPRNVIPSSDWLSEYSPDRANHFAACIRENPTTPPRVAIVELKSGVVRTLADINPEFQDMRLSPAKRVEWSFGDNQKGFGNLVTPPDFQPGARVPLIITLYRANEMFMRGAVGDEYPIQVFAAKGFAVLDLDTGQQPLAAPGDFERIMHLWRDPLESIQAAVKKLDEMGVIIPERCGISGLSHGAEIVNFTITHSSLFRAAVVSSGGARDPSFYYLGGNTWRAIFRDWGLGGRPERESAERWRALSPALNADRVRTPLLQNIPSVDFIGVQQLHTELLELGKPTELFVYPNELHLKNQPKHRAEIYERNLEWFSFWLQDKEDRDPAKADQYVRWRKLKAQDDWNGKILSMVKIQPLSLCGKMP